MVERLQRMRPAVAASPAIPAPDAMSEPSLAETQHSAAAISFDFGSISILPPGPQVGLGDGEVPPALAGHIRSKQGGGAPLDPASRARMEAGFGHPFANVRIHADEESGALNRELSASAFTVGSDIFLGREAATQGTPPPGLLAHESGHVVRQRGDEDAGPLAVVPSDAPTEREASAAAREVSAGRSANGPGAAATGQGGRKHAGALLQRSADEPKPADIQAQSDFNPLDRRNRLLRAIDQSQVDISKMKRHVDFAATVAALSDLTAKQAKDVADAYAAHEDRTLVHDLFETGESGFPGDLTKDQSDQIRALLGGTVAEKDAPQGQQAAAATHAGSAQAAEVHRLLAGHPGEEDAERVLDILRQGATANEAQRVTANQALVAGYARLGGNLSVDLAKLGPVDAARAGMLLTGDTVAADATKVGEDRERLVAIDKKIAGLQEEAEGTFGSVGALIQLKRLRDERKRIVQDIERRAEQAGTDAREAVKGTGAGATAAKERVAAVLGDTAGTATLVGGTDAALVLAIADDDPPARVAAQLRKSAAADKLTGREITASLRGLRAEAEVRAEQLFPNGDPRMEATANDLADKYFAEVRAAYNSLITGEGTKFDELVDDSGDEGDQMLNIALMQGDGKLSDIAELIFALKDDRKDMAAVQNVLRNKSAKQIKDLGDEYKLRTGKSLEAVLFGDAPTKAGGNTFELAGQEINAETGQVLTKGKASGTDRLNLEDFMQRPETEGGPQEVEYIRERAEREYQYALDNGGITGSIRDTFGNEERALLDETIAEVRARYSDYCLLIGWDHANDPAGARVARPEMVNSGEAQETIARMRLARATIRGDRAAYEQATAQLRGMIEFAAEFALQIALTAILTPAAGAVLKALQLGEAVEVAAATTRLATGAAELGEAAETATMTARIATWTAKTSVNLASTIGSHAIVRDHYSLAMFEDDLLGGLGGSIGGDAVGKMLGPLGKKLEPYLGKRFSEEIVKAGGSIAGMEGGAWAQGLEGDLTLQSFITTHFIMGKTAEAMQGTHLVAARPTPNAGSTGGTAAAGQAPPEPAAKGTTVPEERTAPAEHAAPSEHATPMEPTATAQEPVPQESHLGTTPGNAPRQAPVPTGETTVAGSGARSAGGKQPATPEPLPTGAPTEEPGQTAAPKPTATEEPPPGGRSPTEDDPTHVDIKPVEEDPTLVDATPVDEEQTRVDWEPDVVHELPDGSAMWMDSPKETRAAYNESIRKDSRREVAIYRNRKTGETVIVQGTEGAFQVDLQVAHEALPGPPGAWELEAHYHPINQQTGVTRVPQRLPTSTNGDFAILEWQAQRTGNRAQRSRIDYIVEGDKRGYTEYSYEPGAEKPYKIDYPDPVNGERVQVEFKSREAYEAWFGDNFPGYRANIDGPMPAAGGAPGGRTPTSEGGAPADPEGAVHEPGEPAIAAEPESATQLGPEEMITGSRRQRRPPELRDQAQQRNRLAASVRRLRDSRPDDPATRALTTALQEELDVALTRLDNGESIEAQLQSVREGLEGQRPSLRSVSPERLERFIGRLRNQRRRSRNPDEQAELDRLIGESERLQARMQAEPSEEGRPYDPRDAFDILRLQAARAGVQDYAIEMPLHDEVLRGRVEEYFRDATAQFRDLPGGDVLRDRFLELLGETDTLTLTQSPRQAGARIADTPEMRREVLRGIEEGRYPPEYVAEFTSAQRDSPDGWPRTPDGRAWEVDHVIELWAGGPDDIRNYLALDPRLHDIKSEVLTQFRLRFRDQLRRHDEALDIREVGDIDDPRDSPDGEDE